MYKDVTIVAIRQKRMSNLATLPVSWTFESIGRVIFTADPRGATSHDKESGQVTLSRNCDYILDFIEEKDKYLAAMFIEGERYYHRARTNKITQFFQLMHFNRQTTGMTLMTPHQFTASPRVGGEEYHAISRFGVIDCVDVIIKPSDGARGSNHLVVPANMVPSVVRYLPGLKLKDFSKKFPDIIISKGSDMDEVVYPTLDEMVVCERLTNVTKEYRLLTSAGKIYYRERSRIPGSYTQANLNLDSFSNISMAEYLDMEDGTFPIELCETLKEFIKYVDLPFGSIDLYHTEDDKWGIFEYSEQFGFHGADVGFIRKLHLDAVEHILIDKLGANSKK